MACSSIGRAVALYSTYALDWCAVAGSSPATPTIMEKKMTIIYFILAFTIINVTDSRNWEEGTVIARSCAEAISYVQNGLRENQRLIVDGCIELAR